MMLIHSPSGWCLNFYVLKCAGTSLPSADSRTGGESYASQIGNSLPLPLLRACS